MPNEFEELLEDTRSELNRLRVGKPTGAQPQTGRGRALDGRIDVEMGPDGRLTGLALDPAVLRMDERILAREIMTAVNAAWAARQGVDEAAAATAAIDPAALQERLTEVQDRGLASMRRFTEGMQSVLDQIEARVPR